MTNPAPTSPHSCLPVLLSASLPDALAGTPEGQRLLDHTTAIVEALFDAGIHLVFGGHPTITPLVHRAARARGAAKPPIDLFQLERFRGQTPPEVGDARVFDRVHWVGDPQLPLGEDLSHLRGPMVALARAAIFIGGQTGSQTSDQQGDQQGCQPGIRDEFTRFRARHPEAPIYLVGGAGGETARLVAEAQGQDCERNGLQGEAREVLHASHNGHIVAALIARDLVRYCGAFRHPCPPPQHNDPSPSETPAMPSPTLDKHLPLVQGVINRLAGNSFSLKGWSVTLVSALLALAGNSGVPWAVPIALLPALTFWGLDGFFLAQERLYRDLYARLIAPGSQVPDYSMVTPPCTRAVWRKATFSRTLVPFHGSILAAVVAVLVYLWIA
jgi:hypothetical protein